MKKLKVGPYLAAVLYALIVGFSFLFSKIALGYCGDVLYFLSNRFLLALVFLLIYILVTGKKVRLKPGDFFRLVPLALASPMIFTAMQAYGLSYTSSSEAGIILATMPVFTLILASQFLGEKTNIYQKLGVLLSIGGVVFIMLKKESSGSSSLRGIVYLLISSFSFGLYSVLARKQARDYNNLEISLVMMLVSAVFFNGLALAKGLVNRDLISIFSPYRSREFIVAILYLGVLSTLLTSVLTNYVLSELEASKMIVFTNLGTVISILAGYLVLNEDVYYYHIVGSALIILGIFATNYFGRREAGR